MKVLALTRYGREGASSRVRFLQFFPALAAAGIDVIARPLWDPGYLKRWYRDGARPPRTVLARYARRALTVLREPRGADVVWVEGELFPYLPAFVERALRTPFVVDLDDAVYEKYARGLLRPVLGNKIDDVMKAAAAVVAGNPVVAARAREAGARRVDVIPTVVDVARYPVTPAPRTPPLRVCWIGTPHTAQYLRVIAEPLRRASEQIPLRFVVIGAEVTLPGVHVENHPWSEDSEAALIAGCHVGVMPLPDEPWERGKSGYKLIQCMAAARPVIASPVGVNTEIVTPDVGDLASSADAWTTALVAAMDPGVRARRGEAARRRVEERYSLDVAARQLVDVLRWAADRR